MYCHHKLGHPKPFCPVTRIHRGHQFRCRPSLGKLSHWQPLPGRERCQAFRSKELSLAKHTKVSASQNSDSSTDSSLPDGGGSSEGDNLKSSDEEKSEADIDLISLSEVQDVSRAAFNETEQASTSGRNSPTLVTQALAYVKHVLALLKKSWRRTMSFIGSILGWLPWLAREMQIRQLRNELKKDPTPER